MKREWKKEYSVGIEEIDNQHKKIFEIITRANENLLEEEHKGEQELIIKELFDYADYHFENEEKYFEKFGYSEKGFHIEEHNKYRVKILDFFQQIIREEDVYANMVDFVYSWWIEHILNVDKKYTNNFHEHGLK